MLKYSIFLIMLLVTPASFAQEMIQVGDTIPSFDLPYATKDSIEFDGISSEDLKGQSYVLAFYPADWSSGCTREVCTFRDEFSDFEALDIEILPISADLVFSHHEFAKYHNLPFKLLADQTREFGKQMGVYIPERGMFRRSVFAVSGEGIVTYTDYDYSVADSADFVALKQALSGR